MAFWFFQVSANNLFLLRYWEGNGFSLSEMGTHIFPQFWDKEQYTMIYLPHDAAVIQM